MTPEELKLIDFSKTADIIREHSKQLKEAGINHCLIAEVTSADDTYSKYTSTGYLRNSLSEEVKDGEILSGLDAELAINHMGGIVAVVLDLFGASLKAEPGNDPSFEDVIARMMIFHRVYINNVQP